jgi:hypothetical protein
MEKIVGQADFAKVADTPFIKGNNTLSTILKTYRHTD